MNEPSEPQPERPVVETRSAGPVARRDPTGALVISWPAELPPQR